MTCVDFFTILKMFLGVFALRETFFGNGYFVLFSQIIKEVSVAKFAVVVAVAVYSKRFSLA